MQVLNVSKIHVGFRLSVKNVKIVIQLIGFHLVVSVPKDQYMFVIGRQ